MKLIDDKMIQDLTDSLGLRFLPEENREEILNGTLEIISKRAGLIIINVLSEEEAGEFNKIPKDNLEKMEDFMIAKNPDAKSIFEKEAEKVKQEMLSARV